jgi:N-acetyl-anhydromuramyl-L-alanine amidase AmpD
VAQLKEDIMGEVRRPHERVTNLVRNKSSRGGAKPSLIVVHSTEGQDIPHTVRDLQSLGWWFDNPAADASSHVGVDGDGYSALYVPDHLKAWTCAYYNPVSLNIECIGKAAQPASQWETAQYKKVAMYIAYWSVKYGIPIRKGAVTRDGRVSKSGVIRHSDLGRLGGDHHDPGRNFDLSRANDIARGFRKNGW